MQAGTLKTPEREHPELLSVAVGARSIKSRPRDERVLAAVVAIAQIG